MASPLRAFSLDLLVATLVYAGASMAQSEPAKFDVAKFLAPTDAVILHGKDLETVDVYEWERDGVRFNAWPGDQQTPPHDAAILKLKAFSFPQGMIRALYYKQGVRTPPHANTEDIVMYGITGKRVQIVDQDVGILGPGDAAYHPMGVSHHSESVVEGAQLEFAFAGKKVSHPQAAWLSAKDILETPVAAWVRDGKQMTARGDSAAAAPKDAIRFMAKFFQFPGITLVEAHIPTATTSLPHADGDDRLVYILKGRMRVTIGETTDEVGSGDALREPAGVSHHYAALEDTVFLEAIAPKSPTP
jgi:quercetin dioxygenase-like cupin family protein